MTLKQRYAAVLGYFREHVPVAESELHFNSPYQLLVATILSAQCTDRRVNLTTPSLFKAFPTPQALADVGLSADLVVDDGVSPGGVPSTVVRILPDGSAEILRPGPVSLNIVTCGTKRKFAEVNTSLALNFGD